MNNTTTFLKLVKNLIRSLDVAFDENLGHSIQTLKKANNIYSSLFRYFEEEGDDGIYDFSALYSAVQYHQILKKNIIAIENLENMLLSKTFDTQIPEIKIVNRPSIDVIAEMDDDDLPF